ncbi:MAG: UvrD-helicase domain-containing protein [Christensenellales bacterium]
MPKWTAEQREAIAARSHQVLVSAAAGSGKTSVLVERVMTLLRGGASLERILIVTFTKAAAGEMRERLSLLLSEEARHDAHLRRQYAAINRADISTLHTFCGKIIRRYFQAAGADPLSRVDDSRAAALRERAMAEVMEALYESPGEDGQCLIDQYDGGQIEEMLQLLYTFLMAQDSPWAWLEEHLALPSAAELPQHPWYLLALAEARRMMAGAAQLAEDNLRLTGAAGGPARYLKTALEDQALVGLILDSLDRDGRLPEGFDPLFSRLPSTKAGEGEDPALGEQFKGRRDDIKALSAQVTSTLPGSAAALQKAADDIAFTWPALRALCALCRQMHESYQALKDGRQLWDYNDLEHMALQCLHNEGVRLDLQAGFDAICVDEYQDISRIQDAIIQRLHSGHASLFMVGDVKQSIYRFRLAEPALFMEKQDRFGTDAEARERLVTLRENFRSRQNILLAVNHVFQMITDGGALEIRYDENAALHPGLFSQGDPRVELHLVSGEVPPDEAWEEDEEEEAGEEAEEAGEIAGGPENEAEQIARRIEALLGSPIPEGEGSRPLRLRDMVILLRSASGRAARMVEVLRSHAIPVYSDADQQYFDLIEVKDMLNLLTVLDDPLQDEPLLAVLASPTFGYTTEDLAEVRAGTDGRLPFHEVYLARAAWDGRCRQVLDQLESWRFACLNTPLDAFLRKLIKDSGVYTRAGLKNRGELRRANLRLLCERAAPAPLPQTLHSFLSRVREARRQESTKAAAALGAGEDLVRIMTIHKSKGLEFPVVFLPDLARNIKLGSQGELLHLDAEGGLALRKVDRQLHMQHQTFAGKAIQLRKNSQQRSEEARLLYVAMTRARDRLILLASPDKLSSARRRWALPRGDYASRSARSMMDWLGLSLWPALAGGQDCEWTAPNGSTWQVLLHPALSLSDGPGSPLPLLRPELMQPSAAMRGKMAPLPPAPALPLKLSVTQLLAGHREDGEETALTKRFPLSPAKDALPSLRGAPGEGGAARGVATHRAMSSLSLQALRGEQGQSLLDAVRGELDRLMAEGVLQAAQREAVAAERLCDFFISPLGCRMLCARDIQREWPFSLLVEEGLVLQGVLDCCFLEDGQWVLIDYKTDRASPESILSLYRDQMRWYMRALHDITGLPVREAYLYLLSHSIALPVTQEAPITLHESGLFRA